MVYNTGSVPSAEGKKEYTWEVDNFLGVDFAHSPIDVDPRRSPCATNMMKEDGILQKRRSFCPWLSPQSITVHGSSNAIFGVHKFAEDDESISYLIHSGTNLFKVQEKPNYTETNLYNNMNCCNSVSKTINGLLYILDGKSYYQYDGKAFKEVEGFIPTTSIGRSPQGGGEYLYAVNLLQTRRKNTFLSDGESTTYQLSDDNINDEVVIVGFLDEDGNYARIPKTPNGLTFTRSTTQQNIITFSKPPFALGYKTLAIAPYTGDNPLSVDLSLFPENATSFTINGLGIMAATGKLKIKLSSSIANPSGGSIEYYSEVDTNQSATAIGGVWSNAFYVNKEKGQVSFTTAPPKSILDGWDNIEIEFGKDDEVGNRIHGCDIMATYGYNGAGDRLVLAGNIKLKNWDFISAIDDPTYFPATHYSVIGDESTAIMGYSIMADGTQAIHKEWDGINPTVYYREGLLLSDEQVFSVKEGIVGSGAISKHCFAAAGSDPLFLSKDGVCSIVPVENSNTNERSMLKRSFFIDAKLKNEKALDRAVAVYHGGYYFLAVNDNVYVADTRIHSGISELSEWQYEWYFLCQIPVNVFFTTKDDILCFGDKNGNLCYLAGSDDYPQEFTTSYLPYIDNRQIYDSNKGMDIQEDIPVKSQWCTPLTNLGSSVYRKNVKHTNIITDPNDRTSVEMNIDYLDPYTRNVVSASDLNSFNFWNSDFTNFPFGAPNPEILTMKQKAKKVKLIAFRFWSNAPKRCSLLNFVCTYTYGGKIKN